MQKIRSDGFFKILTKKDGIYLEVYPNLEGGKKVEKEEILIQLKERGIRINKENEELIEAAVEKAEGMPIKIAERSNLPEKKLLIELSEDKMEAYLTLLKEDVELEEVKKELFRHNVIYNILEDVIIEMIESKQVGIKKVVAKGLAPIHGKDSVIEYKFRINKKIEFEEKEDGRVDFRELNLIESATANQLLAVKRPATKGIKGMRVTGEEIPARDGQDNRILLEGKNTVLSSDGLELRAKINGEIILKDNRIDIEPVHEVHGDVDYSVGNIDFPGSIIIHGNVLAGFKVRAKGSIEIRGCVEKAEVYSEKDIYVGGGIINCNGEERSKVTSKNNIIAHYIEHSNVEAGGDVIVSECIVYSKVVAKKRIIVQGKIGAIIGGGVYAGEHINAKVIGSPAWVPLEVEVGTNPIIKKEIADLMQDIEEEKKRLEKIERNIKTLMRLKEENKLDKEKETLLLTHLEAKNAITERLHMMWLRLPSLQSELLGNKKCSVAVSKVIYPGVKLTIRTATLNVNKEYRYVTFTGLSGHVEFQPYTPPKDIPIYKETRRHILPTPLTIKQTLKASTTKKDKYIIKTTLIAVPIGGVPVNKLKRGHRILLNILDPLTSMDAKLSVLKEKMNKKVPIVACVEDLINIDSNKTKVIARLSEDTICEAIVANSLRVKTISKKPLFLFLILTSTLIALLCILFL